MSVRVRLTPHAMERCWERLDLNAKSAKKLLWKSLNEIGFHQLFNQGDGVYALHDGLHRWIMAWDSDIKTIEVITICAYSVSDHTGYLKALPDNKRERSNWLQSHVLWNWAERAVVAESRAS